MSYLSLCAQSKIRRRIKEGGAEIELEEEKERTGGRGGVVQGNEEEGVKEME